jgi:ribosomal protein S18 acetylase RimI-like enzyme
LGEYQLMSNIQIRPARTSDAQRLAALAIEVWLATYCPDGVNDLCAEYVLREYTEANFRNKISQQQVWVAAMGDGLQGFASLDPASQGPWGCELTKLYVRKAGQRQGLGARLLAAVRQEQPTLWLTVYHGNQNAIDFYTRQGLERVGTTWFELGDEKHENHIMALSCA